MIQRAPDDLKREGNRRLVARDYDGAEEAFRALSIVAPHLPDGFIGIAKTWQRTDRFEEIVTLLEQVYSRFESAQLLQLLADAYRVLVERGQLDMLDRAILRYHEYHLRRRDPITLYYLGHLLFDYRADYENAVNCFKESWDLDPKSQPAYQAVLKVLRKLGRESEVERMRKLWRERAEQRGHI